MIEIRPLDHCDTTVSIPGSKSYTHRALIISALAEGKSVLINALRSEDTEYTIQGLKRLGVQVLWNGDLLHVLGKGGRLQTKEEKIFVGNSGTSMRFLTALAALRHGYTMLDGSERMRNRPMEGLLGSLRSLGVEANSKGENGCPPVMVNSQGLQGGTVKVKGEESSQFLSALLMVAPYALRDIYLEVIGPLVSKPYIEITRNVMTDFGVEVRCEGDHSFFVKSGQNYGARTYLIEGDTSQASYFFAAAAVTGGRVRIQNFSSSSVQGDVAFLDILERMGCKVMCGDDWAEIQGGELRGIEIDMNAMPDLVPTLAITSAFARGKTLIKNIGHLRFKESDRIRSLVCELAKMGILVEEGEDYLKIERGLPRGTEIDTHNDHRLVMSFAIAGLGVPGLKIKGEGCVNKSFPGFWNEFQRLYL